MENAVFTTLCMMKDEYGRLLVQERKGVSWEGLAFPGGHVEPGESFTESVVREVREETGYTIENPHLCGIKQFPLDEGGRYIILLYRADKYHGELQPSNEGNVFWAEREKLIHSDLAPDMADMIEIFEDDHKSEFYYYPDGNDWRFKII